MSKRINSSHDAERTLMWKAASSEPSDLRKIRKSAICGLLFVVVMSFTGCGKSEETLLGVDADGNGVRDDVQLFIKETYGDNPALRKRLERVSALQRNILRDADDEALIKTHYAAYDYEIDCISYENDWRLASQAIVEIRAQLLDTREKISAYLRAQSHLGGTAGRLPSYEELSEICSE